MPVPLPVNFVMGALPLGFKGNLQEYANAIADALSATVEATFLTGQIGGSMPTSDIGPWANGNEWWFWDPSTGQYQPSEQGVPIGSIIAWGGVAVPANWLLCDGRQVSRAVYSRLYQRIGNTWGAGDGQTSFNLPPAGRVIIGAPGFADPGSLGGSTKFMLTQAEMPGMIVFTHGIKYSVNTTAANATIFGLGSETDPELNRWHVLDGSDNWLGNNQQPVDTIGPYMAANMVIKYQ